MNPDSNREWFIYFKEKEMGPLPESQVKLRFTQGEFDGTAFVFTEGMSDWVSIDEVEVFVEAPEEAEAELLSENAGSMEASGAAIETTSDLTSDEPIPQHTPPLPSEASAHAEGVEEQRFEESPGELPPIEQELQGSGLQVEKLGGSQSEPAAEPAFLEEDKHSANASKKASAEAVDASSNRRARFARLGLLFFTAVLACAIFYDIAKVTDGGQPAFMKALLGNFSEFQSGDEKSASDQNVAATEGVDLAKTKEDIVWGELQALRRSQDGSVAPFVISSQLFSEGRPIVTGAVSSLVDVDRVHLLVMPDLPRSTMAHPEFWWFSLALVDGYFAAGPLNIDGDVLPDGDYRVWAQADGKFLGEVRFTVGEIPRGPEAEVIEKEIQNQRQMRASEERGFLDEKVSELSQLYEVLRKDSLALAIKGAAKRKEWESSQQTWTEAFENIQLQLSAASLASYYPDFQSTVMEFSNEMLRMKGLMDLYNSEGRSAFEKRAGTRFTPLWNALKNERDALLSEASELEGQMVDQVFVDEEAAKAVLLGLE